MPANYAGTGLPPSFWENIARANNFMQQTMPPSSIDIAIGQLRGLKSGTDVGSPKGGGNAFTKSVGALGWLMDKVERPLYGVENAVKHDIQDVKTHGVGALGNVAASTVGMDRDFWHGFTKQEKVSGADVVNTLGIHNKIAKGILGFGVDVGLDPTTYIPGGAILKALRGGTKGAKAVEEATALEKVAAKAIESGKKPSIALERISTPKAITSGKKAIEGKRIPLALEAGPIGKQMVADSARLANTPLPGGLVGKAAEQLNLFPVPTFRAGATGTEAVGRGVRSIAEDVATAATDKEMGMRPMLATTGKPLFGPESVPKLPLFKRNPATGKFRATPLATKAAGELVKSEAEAGNRVTTEVALQRVFNTWDAERKAAPVVNAVHTAESVARSRPAAEIVSDAAAGDPAAGSVIEHAAHPDISPTGAGTTSGTRVPNRTLDELKPSEQALVQKAALKYKDTGLNPADQARMLEDFTKSLKGNKDVATDLMRTTMGELAGIGKYPKDFNDSHFNIADVIDAVGGHDRLKYLGVSTAKGLESKVTSVLGKLDAGVPPQVIKTAHPEIVRAVEQFRNAGLAATVKENTPAIKMVTDHASIVAKQVVEAGGTQPEMKDALLKVIDEGHKALADKPPVARETMQKEIEKMMQPPTAAGEVTAQTEKAQAKASATGVADAAAEAKIMTVAREGSTAAEDLKLQAAHPESPVTQKTLWNKLAIAFDAAWGMKKVRQSLLAGRNYYQSEVGDMRKLLNNMTKTHGKTALTAGWRELQNGEANTQAAKDIKSVLFNLVGANGVESAANEGQSVLLRAGLNMEDLNKELARKGWDVKKAKFGKSYTDQLGNHVDLSNGTDWIKSVYGWNIDDPTAMLSHLTDAVNSSLIHKTVFLDIAEKFGKSAGEKTAHTGDAMFDPEIAKQINYMAHNIDELSNPNSKIWKMMSSSMRVYKSYFTLPNPNHHANNIIGNLWFNWMAGVDNPKHYLRANKAIAFMHHEWKDVNGIRSLGEDALGRSLDRPVDPESIMLTTKGGHKLTVQQFVMLAKRHGVLISGSRAEDIPEYALDSTMMKRLTDNKAMNGLKHFSEMNENWSRFAQFSHELEKTGGSLNEAATVAAARTRKFHPDGTDLSPFEQKWMRNIIPFYSWTRKAIPLAMESAVSNPRKVLAVPKASLALANMMGIPGVTLSNPFPEDQAFPEWIRQNVWGPQLPFGLGGNEGYGMFAPQIPTFDVAKQLDPTRPLQTAKGILSQTNPLIKIPIEMASGDKGAFAQSLFTGKEYKDKSQYFSEQIPIAAQIQRITGRDPLALMSPTSAGAYKQSQGQSPVDKQALLRWLGALGLMDTGRYAYQGQKEQSGG